MIEEFGYDCVMQVPKITKVVVNIGLGEALLDAKALDNARRRPHHYYRAEAHSHTVQEEHSQLQAPRRTKQLGRK